MSYVHNSGNDNDPSVTGGHRLSFACIRSAHRPTFYPTSRINSDGVPASCNSISDTDGIADLPQLVGSLNGKSAICLIDCGASGNFISLEFARRHRIPMVTHRRQRTITLADGSQQSSHLFVKDNFNWVLIKRDWIAL
jgi:hypothetical protein